MTRITGMTKMTGLTRMTGMTQCSHQDFALESPRNCHVEK